MTSVFFFYFRVDFWMNDSLSLKNAIPNFINVVVRLKYVLPTVVEKSILLFSNVLQRIVPFGVFTALNRVKR